MKIEPNGSASIIPHFRSVNIEAIKQINLTTISQKYNLAFLAY